MAIKSDTFFVILSPFNFDKLKFICGLKFGSNASAILKFINLQANILCKTQSVRGLTPQKVEIHNAGLLPEANQPDLPFKFDILLRRNAPKV
ncbi:MAG: hypothetical protein LH614_19490 [Pyrinomonadaceae bacterium]|nr:hypothetical protein [Pyrinomonadaceae bacterium]